jgi:glycosyltransferase involved in cell wall biosynthesis
MVDGRDTLTTFGLREIRAFKQGCPSVICIHRVNECDQRKGSRFMDDLLANVNEVADHTVFISGWLMNYHAARWFDTVRPHSVIHNGADPRVFHPLGGHMPVPGGPFRLVTHHWSDNSMKGFPVYQEIDRLIDKQELPGVEFWVIGRWPADMQWRSARLIGPVKGHRLASLLRQCHAYVTASLWEPGGMHFIEGAQCGLPVLFHEDGGGIVEVAERFGIGFRDDLFMAVNAMRAGHGDLRRRVLEHGPSGERMCAAYRSVIQQLLVARGVGA